MEDARLWNEDGGSSELQLITGWAKQDCNNPNQTGWKNDLTAKKVEKYEFLKLWYNY